MSSDWLSSSDVSATRPSTSPAEPIVSLVVVRVVPALPIVVTVWAIVASTRSSVWTSRAWSAATRSSRFRAAIAPAARPDGHDARHDHPDDAEDQQARAHPPQVDPEPGHRP